MHQEINSQIVCFGGEDWWYHNKAHFDFQLMKRFAAKGKVLYINSLVMQKPRISQGKNLFKKIIRKSESILRGLQKINEGFYVFSPISFPVHHLEKAKQFNDFLTGLQIAIACARLGIENPLVWVACPIAADLAIKMKKTKLVYQRTDRYEEFPNVDSAIIQKYDSILKKYADVTFYVNKLLYDLEASQCQKAMLIDHGVDFDVFANAEHSKEIPEDMTNIPKPIVGFFGNIDDHLFDIPFTEKIVSLMPDISFVFIGKTLNDVRCLTNKHNVWMLGQKNYDKIPQYGKCFDVAIMPWRQNKWIEACNPIKLKEYLALGKPVVSTPFPELNKYQPLVYAAKTPEDFANCIIKAINENDIQKKSIRKEKVQGDTWEHKAKLVMESLHSTEV